MLGSLTRSSFIFQRIMCFFIYPEFMKQFELRNIMHFNTVHGNLFNMSLRLLKDGSACQSARTTIALLQASRVNVLVWPFRSLDTNPIEYSLDVIGREVRGWGHRNVRQLQQFVVEEWNRIAQHTYLMYMTSMRSRCQAISQANGGHTRYWSINFKCQWNVSCYYDE